MKNLMSFFAFVLIAGSLLANCKAFAQEQERHVYVIVTWKTIMPEGGSAAERDSLLTEWFEAVPKKNEKILSTINLRHSYGSDSHDWVVIEEYKNWDDVEAHWKINQELFMKQWPDAKKRAQFNQKLGKYFTGHSDEIYTELPKFRK